MKSALFVLCLICLTYQNRVLYENTGTSDKWSFTLFSSSSEQDTQTYVLPTDELLVVQNKVDEIGWRQIQLQKFQQGGTPIGEPKIFSKVGDQYFRPKVTLLSENEFVFAWIQKIEDRHYLNLQILNNDLIATSNQIQIDQVHNEVSWDYVSEFYYVYQINNENLLIMIRNVSPDKAWVGQLFNYKTQQSSSQFNLLHSNYVEIGGNHLGNVILLQKICKDITTCYVQITKINSIGQVLTNRTLKRMLDYQQYQPKLISLSNNNFVVFYQYSNTITYEVFDQHFDSKIFTSSSKYFGNKTPQWEYGGSFRGGQIQTLALQGSLVIVGINYENMRFQLVQLNNDYLEFIQLREIHFEDLNIYKYSIQKLNEQSIFVQWIDGKPLTMLPEFKQNLYLSQLDLKLNINNCDINCINCKDNSICQQCQNGYNLINNQCNIKCIDNCDQCSTMTTCDVCTNGYIQNNILQCVETNTKFIEELRISQSEITFKYNQRFKEFDNGNLLIFYQEQFGQDISFQLRLLNKEGQIINSYQLPQQNLIGYDIILLQDKAYLYTIDITDNYYVVRQIQFNPQTFEFSTIIRFQIEDQGFKYSQIVENMLTAIPFQDSVGLIIQGLDSQNNIQLNTYFYQYDGKFLSNQYMGYVQYFDYNQDHKYFGYEYDEEYLRILISRGCDLQFLHFNKIGQRTYDGTYNVQQNVVNCNGVINPVISKIQYQNQYMIAIQQEQQIRVFFWKSFSSIYTTDENIKASKPSLISLSEDKFVLIYEAYDLEGRFNSIQYVRFGLDQIIGPLIINQKSVYAYNLRIHNNFYEYITLSWLGYQNTELFSTNQIYFQRVSLIDNSIIGINKQCPINCKTCDNDMICLECQDNYQLLSNNNCQLLCKDGCSQCLDNQICSICQNGFQLTQDNQCQISNNNYITIIRENVNLLESIDMDTNSNGNTIISWIQLDQETQQYKTMIKQIDYNGKQIGKDYILPYCSSTASKVFSLSSYNVICTLCGNVELNADLQMHFYDTDFTFRFMNWGVGNIRTQQYSIHDTPYDVLFISDREFIVASQYMNSDTDVQLRLLRVRRHDFENYFYIQNERSYNFQFKLQQLKLKNDQNYIYSYFENIITTDQGQIQIIRNELKIDYELNEINRESNKSEQQQFIILNNSNRLIISNSNHKIDIQIMNKNKQINNYHIEVNNQETQIIEKVDITQTEIGFYLVWIEIDLNQNIKQIKAQGFYNNGTQIIEQQNLNQLSNQPNNIIIQSLRDNQLITLWYDYNDNGQNIVAARYNKYLQIIPITTTLCLQHCDQCIESNTCTQCSIGYYYNNQQNKCLLTCINNCQICTQNNICDVCQNGYYLINDQCIIDNNKHEEYILTDIQDSQKTRVSITTFNDNGFVIVWNDLVNDYQNIFLKFYDNRKQPIGDIKQINGDSDKQYVKVESLDDDTFGMIWYDGNCADTCRLLFTVLDRNGNTVFNEQTIKLVTLSFIGDQSPVIMKRKGRQLLIGYISYENNKNVGYYTYYDQDQQTLFNPSIIESDNNIDNLEILIYNENNYKIYYVRNNIELMVMSYIDGNVYYFSIHGSQNQIKTPSAIVKACGDITITWVEKVLNNGYLIDKVFVQNCNYWGDCWWSRQLESYQYEQQYQPKLTGKYGNQGYFRYSIIFGAKDYISSLRRKIRLVSYWDTDGDLINNQINVVSYIIRQFEIQEFTSDETILVSVGQMGDLTNKIFITKFDIIGNQQLIGDTICQQNCNQCTSDQICLSCKNGYLMNNGQCGRECDLNCKLCDPYWNESGFQCYECNEGFQLNTQQQCLPVDNSISQQLINTYQTGNQYEQRVAVLQNHNSIIVWTSENQNKYGKSIYMQLYDPQFNKVGPETLITKDNIGIQELPDITALPNNEFMIIWKDNNSVDGRRVLMQRFNDKIERIGNEIAVYDSTVDLYLNGDSGMTYIDSYHKMVSSQNGHLSIIILLKVSQNLYDIKLKQYNEQYQEYNSIPIGSTNSYDECSIIVLNNLVFVTWKSNKGIKIMTINDQGHIINGEIIIDSINLQYPVITPISQDEIILAYSNLNNLIIQKYNIQLQKVNDAIEIKSNYKITGISIINNNNGYVIVYKVLKQSQYYSSDLLYLISYDQNDSLLSKTNQIVNDFYGSIKDIRISTLSNGEFLISWTQLINNYTGIVNEINIDDLNGDGVYIKRYNNNGNVISIQNVVCQIYCKQCSKNNLCEICSDGYQFDINKQNCVPICSSNCLTCTRYLGQYKSYCKQCKDNYNINDQGDCVKNNINDSLQLYRIGNGEWQVKDVLTLQNGNIVVIKQRYIGEIQFKIISPSGDQIANDVNIENGCCEKIVKATALVDGGFVIVHRSFNYWDNSNIYLIIYDQDGRQLKSQALNNFAVWNNNYWWWWWGYASGNSNWLQIKSLNDGGFVVLYMTDNNGQDYHNPQLYLRIYNKDLYLSRNEIKLKTYFNNNYYWDWWRNINNAQSQSINIIENINQIIISFGTCLYNNWDENRNYIQIFVYDKQGQFIQNTQVEVENQNWWDAGISPKFYLFQRSLNQFIIISFSNQKVYANYFDNNFIKLYNKQIDQIQNYYWDPCYGCCYYCWNSFTVQALLMKNSIIISSKPDSNILQLQSFTHNLEPITESKSIQISRQNSGLQWSHFINQYTNDILLVSQILDTANDSQRNIIFDKYDSFCNKQEKWSVCGDNCINCLEDENQCKDCKIGYYPDNNYQCKTRCEYKNCKVCANAGTDQQYCQICQDGYELQDNSECIQIDNQKIRQTQLYINREGQNTPRIKKFLNGEILVLNLYNVNEIYGQYFDQNGKKIGQNILMLKDDKINYYDFSISINEDYIVIGWISTADNAAKGQKYDQDLKKVGSQFTILDSVDYYEVFLLTIDYLSNNKIVCILYGQRLNWMKLIDEINAPQQLKQIQYDLEQHYCDGRFDWAYWDIYRSQYGLDVNWNRWNCYWGWNYVNYWQIYDKNNQRHIDYFQNWYPEEPATLITEDYIIILIQHYNSIHAQTFDYFGNLKYQTFLRYNQPSQPSLALLENGQIIIIWKDQLYNYDPDVIEQEIPGQKRNILAYTITDIQYNQIRYQYISMDYVEEERPSVIGIKGGFAISFSGRSEIASFNIDLRVVYFDLYGNIQTGFIPISTQNQYPTNSNIELLNDGTIIVSWYQNDNIYIQKLDRNGQIKSFTKDIICSDNCNQCTINQKCDICQDGYHLTINQLCKEDTKPQCQVQNCEICENYSGKCKLCKKGYFLNENLIECQSLTSFKNLETEIAKSNIGGEQSTIILQIEDGTIIHLWLNKKLDGSSYELLGQTFSFDSSQILSEQYIVDVPLDVSIKANTKYSKIVIIVYNSQLTQVIQIDQNLILQTDIQDQTNYIKTEFPVSFDWKNQEIHVHQTGYLLQIKGIKQVTLDEQQKNIRKCELTKLLIFQFDGTQQIPPFGFWIDGQSKTSILDDKNKCKIELIHDILYEDYIYVLSDLDWEQNKRYITVYDYYGVKLKERFQDYWNQWGYYWWGYYWNYWWWGNFHWMMNYYSKADYQLQLLRLENSEIAILNREGAGITINNDLNIIRTVEFPINQYFFSDYDMAQVYLNRHAYINVQRFGEVQRYRYYTFDQSNPNHIQESDVISRFTINQGSFNIIRLNEGQLLFNWKELNNNDGNFGSIIVQKLNSEGQLIPFPAYQCVQYCNLCQNEEVCQKCKPNYELTIDGQCSFMCSDNCISCSSRNTCDICVVGAVLDDNQQCYFASSDLLEEPIPTKRSDQQNKPRIAAFKDGNFVVVWQSKNEDGDGFGIYAQKFTYDLIKQGDEIRVNQIVVGEQYFPDVTILDDQSIIIIWADGDIELQANLYYQKFDSDFNRIGNVVYISQITLQYLSYYDTPCVVQALPDNKFAVIWLSTIKDSDMKTNVYVTVFDSNGQQKETDPSSFIDSTKEIVVASNGFNFVTVFSQGCQLKAVVYDLDGIRQSINDITYDCANSPAITTNSLGEYIVSFQVNSQIYFKLFDKSFVDNIVYDRFQVDYVNSIADNPDIATLSDNRIVITWQNKDISKGRSRKLRMQIFDRNGAKLTNAQEINYITLYAELPQISILNNDAYIIVWQAKNGDIQQDSDSGIYLMKFQDTQQLGGGLIQIICQDKCQQCEDIQTCIKCSTDYDLVDSICVPKCPNKCNTCNISNICQQCENGYFINKLGQCQLIGPDPLPSLINPEIIINPTFSSIINYNYDSVVVYAGTIINLEEQYGLDIKLNLYTQNENYEYKIHVSIDIEWLNIYNSDLLIMKDQIVIYWTQQSQKKMKIELHALILDSKLKELNNIIIDTYDLYWYEQIKRKVHIVTMNGSYYYIFQSIQSTNGKFDLASSIVDKNQHRISSPQTIFQTDTQLYRRQIEQNENAYVLFEYTKYKNLRLLRVSSDLWTFHEVNLGNIFNTDIDENSISIKKLHNENYVISWKYKSQLSLCSINTISYLFLNSDLQNIGSKSIVLQSNDILSNPLVISTTSQFIILWNQQSIAGDSLNANIYTQEGVFIKYIEKLNQITNNIIQFYSTPALNDDVYVSWISNLQTKYQFYLTIINNNGVQKLPSIKVICKEECLTCKNEFTCTGCPQNYVLDESTYQCIIQCPLNCKTCDETAFCQVCEQGYHLEKNECVKFGCQLDSNCKLCNESSNCLECLPGFVKKQENFNYCEFDCSHCRVCENNTCKECEESYYWVETKHQCLILEDALISTDIKNPLRANFETGDYVLMWQEDGEIYIQLFRKSGKAVGSKTKVNKEELLNGGNRLLQQSEFQQKLYADLTIIGNEVIVLWVDQTKDDMKIKFKKFDEIIREVSDEVIIHEQPKQNLSQMAAPCLIQKTDNNKFVVGWFNQIKEQLQSSTATMLLQSFTSSLQPLGEISTILNADLSKAPAISADEDGVIYITYSSKGYTYLAQLSQEGVFLSDTIELAHPGQAFKSTSLDNGNMVFIFEAQSTNLSPPQFILSYEIMNDQKQFTQAAQLTQPQFGEEHPDVTQIKNGFIITWRTINKSLKSFKSQDVYFQVFDNFGIPLSTQIQVERQGIHPSNPRAQILNSDDFIISWTGESIVNKQKSNKFYTQQYKLSDIIQNHEIICSENCQSCNQNNTCLTCNQGYIVENGDCILQCSQNCVYCSESNLCDLCRVGYELTWDDQCQQIKCDEGYSLNSDNECEPLCSNNCIQCSSSDDCVQCEIGYTLSQGQCINLTIETSIHKIEDQQTQLYKIIGIVIITLIIIFLGIKIIKNYLIKSKILPTQDKGNEINQTDIMNSAQTLERKDPQDIHYD